MTHGGARSAKSDEAARAAFDELVPDDPRVSVRPMFGSVAAFTGGNMFMGLYANELFVRLAEVERTQLLAADARPLEPMPGRPMREYVVLPDWRSLSNEAREWAARALDYALTLPPK